VWIYLLISFLCHLFASVSLPEVALFVILPPSLAWFVGCSWVFRRQQVAIAKRGYQRGLTSPQSASDLQALGGQQSNDAADVCLKGHRLLRVAQIVCIVCSYVLARLIFAPPDWEMNFLTTLVATIAMGAVWVLMMLWLRFHSPVFLALLSMPPYFNLSNDRAMKNFWKAFKPEHALKVKPLDKRIEISRTRSRCLAPMGSGSLATWSNELSAALPSVDEDAESI